MKAGKCPTDELSTTNFVIASPQDLDDKKCRHVEIYTSPHMKFVFSVKNCDRMQKGYMGFNLMQRRWANVSLNQDLTVKSFMFNQKSDTIGTIVLEVDFLQKKNANLDPHDTDKMAAEFLMQFNNMAFTEGQSLAFQFADKKTSSHRSQGD